MQGHVYTVYMRQEAMSIYMSGDKPSRMEGKTWDIAYVTPP